MRYTEEKIFSIEELREDSAIRKFRTTGADGKSGKTMSGDARMLDTISGLVENLQALNQEAVRAYTPIVEGILRSRRRDARHIEHTLDRLLSFSGHEPALQLCKKLWRHYFSINPVATAEYVHAYREMWDAEQEERSAPVAKSIQKAARKAKRSETKKPRGKKGVSCVECGTSVPLFDKPPRRPFPREPRLAKQSGAKAPHTEHGLIPEAVK